MEQQATNVPLGNRFHLQIRLVSHNMIDEVQVDFRQMLENRVGLDEMRFEAGKENSFVAGSVHQRVSCVAILENWKKRI